MGCFASKAAVAASPEQLDVSDHYQWAGELGKESYGIVRLAYSITSHEAVAVNFFHLHRGQGHLKRLLALHNIIRAEESAGACIGVHPNIVRLREAFVGYRFACFIMELCSSSLFMAWSGEQERHCQKPLVS